VCLCLIRLKYLKQVINYSNKRFRTGFGEDMGYKVQALYDFMANINKNATINKNHSWILENKQMVDEMHTSISNDFTDRKINDFNGTKSVVSILRKGFFGPITMNNSRLNNISNEYMLISGNRLNALQYVYNASIKM
jgi:hypothetical protein